VFQGTDDFVAGLVNLFPGNISSHSADQHPGREQLADLMEGHASDKCRSGGLVIVVEYFGEVDRRTSPRKMGVAARLGVPVPGLVAGVDVPVQQAQATLPVDYGLLEDSEIILGGEVAAHYSLQALLRTAVTLNLTVMVAGFLTGLSVRGAL
jgi:hypothetical protein